MAKARMKWKLTPVFTGTSENRTPVNCAPMYSRKRYPFVMAGSAQWIE
uniref:Uncharacterized protein n=1 Tax=Triticum urartu TaxID=4572 RepID=A0A8R7V599_TRIUA